MGRIHKAMELGASYRDIGGMGGTDAPLDRHRMVPRREQSCCTENLEEEIGRRVLCIHILVSSVTYADWPR